MARGNLQLVPAPAPVEPKRRYTRLTPDARARLGQDIAAALATGQPGKADWRGLADRYQVCLRTVQTVVAQVRDSAGTPPPRSVATQRLLRNPLPADVLEQLALSGNMRKVWRELHATNAYPGQYNSFVEALYRQHGKNVVLGVLHGPGGMTRTPRLRQPGVPFMSRFSIDLFSTRAPIAGIVDPRAAAILVREACTGTIVFTWVFEVEHPAAEDVLTVLAEAVRGRTYTATGMFVGGLPDSFLADNEGILVAAVNDGLRPLGVRMLTINSYSSWENGGHERAHKAARGEFMATWPGSSDGPRDRKGELLPDPRPPLSLADARYALESWSDWRNTEPPSAKKPAPIELWAREVQASGGALPRQAGMPELARFARRHPVTCQWYASGLLVEGDSYISPDMSRPGGKRFIVRRWLRDDRTLEVFDTDDRYITTAVRADRQTAAEAQEVKARRAQEEAKVRDTITRARLAAAAGEAAVTSAQQNAAQEQLADRLADQQLDPELDEELDREHEHEHEHEHEEDEDRDRANPGARQPDSAATRRAARRGTPRPPTTEMQSIDALAEFLASPTSPEDP